MMRVRVLWPAVGALFAIASSAGAIDCGKAVKTVEKLICSDRQIKAADAALSAAYFKLLRSVKGTDVHDVMIASQRRWLTFRDQQDLRGTSNPDEDDPTSPRHVVLGEIKSRLGAFQSSKQQGRSEATQVGRTPFVMSFEKLQAIAAKTTGGRYAGFSTECFFTPAGFGNGGYACPGQVTFQNNERLCRIAVDWASNRETEYRTVATLEDGKVALIATCSFGDAPNESCPATEHDAGARWTMRSQPSKTYPTFEPTASTDPLSRIDPDADVVGYVDEPWLMQCLFDPKFPGDAADPGAKPK